MVALFFCLASALVAAIAGETSSRPADENSAQGPALSVKFDYNKAFHLGLPKLPQLPQLTPPTTTAATPYEGQPATRPPGVLWNVVPALDKYEPETPLGALKGALADKVGPVLRTGLVVAALIAFVQAGSRVLSGPGPAAGFSVKVHHAFQPLASKPAGLEVTVSHSSAALLLFQLIGAVCQWHLPAVVQQLSAGAEHLWLAVHQPTVDGGPGRHRRRAGDPSPRSAGLDRVTRVVLASLEGQQCLQRAVCELGAYARVSYPTHQNLIASMERWLPVDYQLLPGSADENGCLRFACGSVPAVDATDTK